MNLWAGFRWTFSVLLLTGLVAPAAGKDKKESAPTGQIVDAGSFGVFIRGQRVVTETFSIRQENGASRVKSELKETGGATPTDQKSDLEMTANGELIHYDWSQSAPAEGSLMVVPNNEFLLEKITIPTGNKPAEQPFLLPNTSVILDNNFFVHREVLAWRYLAANCHRESGSLKCQKGSAEFGVLVPQERISMRVRIELVGREKIALRGEERDLLRLNLSGQDFDWALWVDDRDQFKLMRVAIPADNTEVVRD